MLYRRSLIFLFVAFFPITPVFAITQSNIDLQSHINNEVKPIKVTGDAIKWEIFSKTKEKTECTVDSEGFDDCLIKPIYSPEIMSLNNKKVTLTGFMFPLSPSDKQSNFLIGPYPASCPFDYHVGPSEIVEVILKTPIKFSYDPVTVKGILSLKYNKETGVFYYLNEL